jgi:uncharacterized membrane protein
MRNVMRWMMSGFFVIAGVLHLHSPDAFLPIVPSWVPAARDVVLITGGCEIVGAIALLTRRLRKFAGIMLAAYAVCVFPANIKHAFYGVQLAGLPSSWWYHAPRLALQPVIVWWALFCSGSLDWPLRGDARLPMRQMSRPR